MSNQLERFIDAARLVLKEQGYFVDNLWHVNDIIFLCEQLGVSAVTREEAMTVFDIANTQFDGEFGLNWPQLERALLRYLQEQQSVKKLCV